MAAAGSIGMTGCISVTALANDFIASLTAIVDADPTAVYVPELQLAIQALKTAAAGWKWSTVNCALQSAANTAAAIINQIIPGSQVALIATVAIAGFDILMSHLAPCTTPQLAVKKFSSASLRNTLQYVSIEESINNAHFWSKQHAYRTAFNNAAGIGVDRKDLNDR